MTEEEMGKSVV